MTLFRSLLRIKAFLPVPLFLLIGVAACFFGNVLPVPVYDTPLSLSLSNIPDKEGKRQCFYFTGLKDDDGRILVNPTQLLRESSVHEHVSLANKGAGLWIDLSDGVSFRLDWKGTLPLPAGTTVWLGGGDDTVINPALSIRVNGQEVVHTPMEATKDQHKSTPVLPFAGSVRFRLVRLGCECLVGCLCFALFNILKRSAEQPEKKRGNTDFAWFDTGFPGGILWEHALLCILCVFLGNLFVFHAKVLWHDDSWWYSQASTILANWPHSLDWYSKVSPLARYRAWLYCHGMAHWGMAWTRALFTAVLAMSSALAFLFYVRGLWLSSVIAFPMAVLPNILPGLIGIPVGLNTTYAVFCLVAAQASMLLYLQTVHTKKSATDAAYLVLSLILLWICISISGCGVFLVPCACLFAITTFFVPRQKLYSSAYILVALGMTFPHALNVAANGPRQPIHVLPQEMWNRFCILLEESYFFSPVINVWKHSSTPRHLVIVVILCLLGLLFMAGRFQSLKSRTGETGVKSFPRLLWFLGLCWFPSWLFFNLYAYVTANPEFRPYDYAYVANFGSVALQIAGLSLILSLVFCRAKQGFCTIVSCAMVSIIIVLCGFWRIDSCTRTYSWFSTTLHRIRVGLASFTFPPNSQIVLLGKFNMMYEGNLYASSGILQYALNRRDIIGLVGMVRPSLHDVYAPICFMASVSDKMHGLKTEHPIFVFSGNNSMFGFQQYGYLIRVVPSATGTSRFEWLLVALDKTSGQTEVISRSVDYSSLQSVIHERGIPETDIAFYFPEIHDRILDEETAKELLRKNNLPILETYGDVAELLDQSVIERKGSREVRLLLRVHKMRSPDFIPAIRLHFNEEAKEVSVWTFAKPGDILMLFYPIPNGSSESDIKPSLWNSSPTPWIRIQNCADGKME